MTGHSADGLELRVAARGSSAVVVLHNHGTDELRVLSHVDAGEPHYDWFTIELAGPGETRTLRFAGARNEAARVIVTLAPGESITHVIDLLAWADRPMNGGRPIERGTYRMAATYVVRDQGGVWTGALRSAEVELTIA